jgi:pyruvate dehydrogenase phosphatase
METPIPANSRRIFLFLSLLAILVAYAFQSLKMSSIFNKNTANATKKAANRIVGLQQHLTVKPPTQATLRTKTGTNSPKATVSAQKAWKELSRSTDETLSKLQVRLNISKLQVDNVQLAANNPIEDAKAFHVESDKSRFYFTIADGHLGPPTARTVAHYLAHYVAAEFNSPDIVALEKKREWKQLTTSGPEQHHPSPEEMPGLELKAEAIKQAFLRFDNDIVNGAILPTPPFAPKTPETALALAGACGIIACLDHRDLFVAGAGDCRAVLGRKDEDWEVVPMSRDHTLKDEEEVKRLLRNHPKQEWSGLVSRGRVLGILMPTRAFGDADFKWSRKVQSTLSRMPLPSIFTTPPYLDASPDIYYHRITASSRFLIMASDGLWDNLSSEEAVALIGKELDAREEVPDSASEWSVETLDSTNDNLATMLLRHSLLHGVCGGDVAKLQQLLSLPSGQARNYRDDVTITVVVFPVELGGMDIKKTEGVDEIDLSLGANKGPGKLNEWISQPAL